MIFKKFRINLMVKKVVLPALSEMELGEEKYIIDKPKFRIKGEVSEDGVRKFTVHELSSDKKRWSYTTYKVAENNDAFAMRSGSYPGSWDK